jgi:phage shock protein PspC (stress-responsive transcriptional regulator)
MTEQTTEPVTDAPPARRLVRSRDRKVIAGVCEGAGRYFDIDPVVFRVVLGVLALTGGLGLVAYGVVWLLVPVEGAERGESEAHRLLSGRVEGTALTAVLVTLVGCGLFLSMLGSAGNQAFSLVLLAALSGAVYWSQTKGHAGPAAPPAPPAPPAAQPPPAPVSASWWREPLTKDAPGTYAWGPDDTPYEDDPGRRAAWRERRRAARRREGPMFGGTLFLLAVAAAATGTAAAWDSRPLGTSLEIGFAAALAVLGLGFVVSTWWGRLGGGTVFWAVVVTGLLVASAALPKSIGTHWAERSWAPTSAAAVLPSYELGSGRADLDLSAVEPGGKTVKTRIELGAGQINVTVPKDVTVNLHVKVGVGDVRLPGDSGKKVNVHPGQDRTVSLGPVDGLKSAGTMQLEVKLGLGQVRVLR